MFKVGQKVICKNYGEGVVSGVCSEYQDYPVVVEFLKGGWEDYTADGRVCAEGNITLFPYSVEIVKAITKPSIDWSHVSEDFQWLAMDEGGLHHLFAEKPEPVVLEWAADALYIKAEHFASFTPGTCSWCDSLVKRPE